MANTTDKHKSRGLPIWVYCIPLAIGLVLMLRPVVYDMYRMWQNSQAVSSMSSTFDDANDPERVAALAQARAYNARLGEYTDPWLGGTGDADDIERPQRDAVLHAVSENDILPYDEQLTYGDDDSVAWVEAPSANIRQLVYLGTDLETLSAGVGQLENTSLPVGGTSSRCVLTGHSGLQNDRMFDDIRMLEVGDLFAVHTLGDTYTYEVDDIRVVEPEEVAALAIEPGRDLCTLVTCTPYRVNTHRLLVTGHRTTRTIEEPTAVESAMTYATNPRVLPSVIAVLAILLTLAIIVISRRRRKRKQQATLEAPTSADKAIVKDDDGKTAKPDHDTPATDKDRERDDT